MVQLPSSFVMTRAPGYFWDLDSQKLYSIKSGNLKPLALKKGGYFFGVKVEPGYQVSVNGTRRTLPLTYLRSLKIPETTQIVKVIHV